MLKKITVASESITKATRANGNCVPASCKFVAVEERGGWIGSKSGSMLMLL
jgi:hypothetical protein